ncbi:MAG TPA: T9SS type A sorting domain-containing protein [Parafilimonas sp.]|nr:T9SS type A sorting domain-containing protein [Parafilimonas sp.]
MKGKYIFYLIFSATISLSAPAQGYKITWQRTIGGNNADKLTGMLQTFDGGLILCGYSNSNISGDKTQNSVSNTYDYWIVKLAKTGITQWTKTYGGSDRDLEPRVIQTKDSGYLVAGSSISSASGGKTENAINNSFDYWTIKLDKHGNQVWDNTVGGIQFEKLAAVLESPTGYFLCGSSNSTYGNDKSLPNEGSSLWPDYWVVKLNKSGVVLWDSTYGSKNRDALTTAQITADGGIILGGSSYSPAFADKSEDFKGNNDYWVVKLNANGAKQWDKTIGGSLSDYLIAIDTIGSNGYILAGYSNSPASFNKTDSCRGVTDYWIVRLDNAGNITWNKTYGGSKEDHATSVKYTNGHFLVGGYSNSPASGDKKAGVKGGMDFWTLILDQNGKIKEQKVWGGKADDRLVGYIRIGLNEYLLGGTSWSALGKDKAANTVGNTGKPDYWIFRISPSGTIAKQDASTELISMNSQVEGIKRSLSFSINPNPVKNVLVINHSAAAAQNLTLSIYSNNGQLVRQQQLTQSKGTQSFDFSAQPSGIYYAVLQSGSSSVTKKFVKN